MKTAILPVLLASTIALAACQQNADPAASAEKPGVEPSVSLEPAPSAAAGAMDTQSAAKNINLSAEGLIIVNAVDGRGTATNLTFGMPQSNVLDAMRVDFGKPTMSSNGECGAGPMEFAIFGALQLNFLDGKFAGWFAEKGDNLVTIDGIRPGTPVEGLRAARQVTMANSTLDGEFSYVAADGKGIGGFVDGSGKIGSLYAGVNCFFR